MFAVQVLEEAPAPGLDPKVRAAMGQSAVQAALAVGAFYLLDDYKWIVRVMMTLFSIAYSLRPYLISTVCYLFLTAVLPFRRLRWRRHCGVYA